jgi:hypothetical protein
LRIKSNNINIKKIFELTQFKTQFYILASIISMGLIFVSIKFMYDIRNLTQKEQRSIIINQVLTLINLPKTAYIWISNKSFDANPEINSIKINIKPSNYQKLMNLRNKAVKGPIIKPEHKIEIPALLNYKGVNYNVSVRLKGESAPHHAKGSKWSIRVDSKGTPIEGELYSFNLQHPKRRSYIMSMLMRIMMSSENHPHNKMALINLKINDLNMGIYNLEEVYSHKSLSQKTGYSSVVFSFDETNTLRETSIISNSDLFVNGYWKSTIKPTQPKEVFNNKNLYNQFRRGSLLLEKFRSQKLTTSQVFDLDKLASWLAIGDLFGGWHGFSWGNVKFSYDPKIDKIYPLIWDMIDEDNAATSEINNPLNVRLFRLNDPYMDPTSVYWKDIFSDPKLISAYIRKLNKLCKNGYVNNILSNKSALIKNYMSHLHKDYPQISYKTEIKKVYDNINFLRTNYLEPTVPAFASLINENNKPQLILLNRNPIPLEIIGIRNKITDQFIPISDSKIIVPRAPFKQRMKKFVIDLNLSNENKINFNKTSDYIVEGRLMGIDKINKIKIDWYAHNFERD